ncbi:hypothetical protein [Turneriella parva]|uniref:Uncharacterized protein n=1 Tax=Turneriella parva (strain ATCC BAA-1111 / DSM 21527 / NCTC 11395 / H) TaxID=869212 RepID=I4B5J9_TURPD|nr:hypothetical protein [Turneriella parva]AFM12556.1 hypothetical protein Turpa_1909 [Turneriella parva DSM 21527]
MQPEEKPKPESQVEYEARVERSLRRGNINFDFLNPVQLRDEVPAVETDRRTGARAGKRGLFNRGRKQRVLSDWFTVLWLAAAAGSVIGFVLVWKSSHFLALLAVPFLLSSALASLIMLGLFLARPR